MPKKTHADRQRDFARFLEHQERQIERARRANPSEIPVFYNEQDQDGNPATYVSREEAWDLKRAGEGTFICRGKKFRLNRRGPAPPPLRFSSSLSPDSDASVSVSEMRANVGEPADTPGAEIPRHVVQRAQQKIRAIGERLGGTFDRKAPLAFGMWATNLGR